VVEIPGKRISEIEILSEEEKNQIIYAFNDTKAELPEDKSIQHLFERQAASSPDKIVVMSCEPGQQSTGQNQRLASVSGKELNETANQLARLLRQKGTKTDSIIAIMLEPSIELVIGVMAVLKTGGAYLPINYEYPRERINFMLRDSGTQFLLSQKNLAPQYDKGIEILYIDKPDRYEGEKENLNTVGSPSALVYMIYTSGTTGRSKGVLVKHQNLVNYVGWFIEKIDLTVKDRAILISSFAFDLGYTSFFSSILSGGLLFMPTKEIFLSPERLLGCFRKYAISFLKLTPSLFGLIVNSPAFSAEMCQQLKWVVLGGEPISPADVKRMHEICNHVRFMNHYGPTETTIGSIAHVVDFNKFEEYQLNPTIGKPIHNTRVYILAENLQTVPMGVPGELCIGGSGVARGYLNNPELTSKRFILAHSSWLIADSKAIKGAGKFPMSYELSTMSCIYKTGDLARWLPGDYANIEFLGRIDKQVKIRGYRIELEEIETRLLSYENVKEAVVIVRENQQGEKYIIAYIIEDKKLNIAELKSDLSCELPEYMIPSYFVKIEKIPLNQNGKIDRKALPPPELKVEGGYIAPRNQVEEKLLELWSDVLGIEKERIGIDGGFFNLGGHSLKAAVLVARIHAELDVKVPLTELFKSPTIRVLSEYIKGQTQKRHESILPVEEKEYYPLSSAQRRLFTLQQMDLESTNYNIPVQMLLEGSLADFSSNLRNGTGSNHTP
jgi:amino acid adenylation domain-containing protein